VTPRESTYHGILPLYKRPGLTSHDAVDAVRRLLRQRSVGHAGTLDPAAEGLLVILLGRGTKVARFLSGERKKYEARVTLGRVSSTYDDEGLDLSMPANPIPDLSVPELDSVLDKFRGKIHQQVPAFSAVRVNGERLYARARKGEVPERPSREVTIYDLRLTDFDGTNLKLEIVCGSGTYVRSLAHDIGREIGCGGYLSHLKRMACGNLQIEDAVTLETIEDAAKAGEAARHVLTLDRALGFSAVTITDAFRSFLRNGRRPVASDILRTKGTFSEGDPLLVMDPEGCVMAVGIAQMSSLQLEKRGGGDVLRYDRVLA